MDNIYKLKRRAFTLIEIIIVIIVIGILSGLAAPKIINIKKQAEFTTLVRDIDVLERIIPVYENDKGDMPLIKENGMYKKINASNNLLTSIATINDDGSELYEMDLSKSSEFHSRLKHGYRKYGDDDYFIYSKKTGYVYYAKGFLNDAGELVYFDANITNIATKIGTVLLRPKDQGSSKIEEQTNYILSGKIQSDYTVKVKVNGIEESDVWYNNKAFTSTNTFMKNVYASSYKTFNASISLSVGTNNIEVIIPEEKKTYLYDIDVTSANIKYSDTAPKNTTGQLVKIYNSGREKMFDKDYSTYYNLPDKTEDSINISGDMTNRIIKINGSASNGYPNYFSIIDELGKPIPFICNNVIKSSVSFTATPLSYNIIIPEKAKKILFNKDSYARRIYEVEDFEDKTLPNAVSNVSYTSGEINIKMKWTNPADSDFNKVLIFRNDVFVGSSIDGTFNDMPLLEDMDYVYNLYAEDKTGNLSNKVIINARTKKVGAVFKGIDLAALDKNTATYAYFDDKTTKNVTWDDDLTNSTIKLTAFSSNGGDFIVKILDKNNQPISFTGNNKTVTSLSMKYNADMTIIIPPNAKSMQLKGGYDGTRLYELTECLDTK